MKAGRRSRLSLGRGSGSHLKVGNPDPSHGTKMKGDRLVRDDIGGSQEIFIGEVEVRSCGGEREEKRRERERELLVCWVLYPLGLCGAGPREGGRCFFLTGPPLAGSDSARSRRGEEPGTGPILRYGAILRYPMLPNSPPFLFS